MAKEKDEKQIQELYMEFNMLNQQINEFQKQIQSLEETIFEVNESKKGIIELSKIQGNKEILVPIVSGIFAKAEIKDTSEFIVNVGASTAVLKSAEEVQKLLEKQLDEIQKTQHSFIDNLQELTMRAKDLRQELKNLIKE